MQGDFLRGRPHVKGSRLQRAEGRTFTSIPSAVEYSLGKTSAAACLPRALQQKMEAAFGASFARVRLHIGPEASALGARAFTIGEDIYIAPAEYRPETRQGQALLAHELTHVIQQRQGRVPHPTGHGLAIIQDADLEAEADTMANRVVPQVTPFSTAQERALRIGPLRGGFSGRSLLRSSLEKEKAEEVTIQGMRVYSALLSAPCHLKSWQEKTSLKVRLERFAKFAIEFCESLDLSNKSKNCAVIAAPEYYFAEPSQKTHFMPTEVRRDLLEELNNLWLKLPPNVILLPGTFGWYELVDQKTYQEKWQPRLEESRKLLTELCVDAKGYLSWWEMYDKDAKAETTKHIKLCHNTAFVFAKGLYIYDKRFESIAGELDMREVAKDGIAPVFVPGVAPCVIKMLGFTIGLDICSDQNERTSKALPKVDLHIVLSSYVDLAEENFSSDKILHADSKSPRFVDSSFEKLPCFIDKF